MDNIQGDGNRNTGCFQLEIWTHLSKLPDAERENTHKFSIFDKPPRFSNSLDKQPIVYKSSSIFYFPLLLLLMVTLFAGIHLDAVLSFKGVSHSSFSRFCPLTSPHSTVLPYK